MELRVLYRHPRTLEEWGMCGRRGDGDYHLTGSTRQGLNRVVGTRQYRYLCHSPPLCW